ncbi:related to vacuolar atp synthase subunit g (vma-10) [Armillaria ostoyae]|uniref:V-type proton ATPase subunit G n=1 Tax=Armillaria ostoyae TaxID=47428 RepID=A0A284R4B8_ARMOS|nr:related to vacuolar atp synthase subunit g (vma-10) [Armillaria ostoyae]
MVMNSLQGLGVTVTPVTPHLTTTKWQHNNLKESRLFLRQRKRPPKLYNKPVNKLKDARSEASKEIEAYKKAKEEEFKAFEASHAGTTSSAQASIDKETDIKLQSITESFNSNKEQVVKKLLDRVVLVKPELHRNLKKI